MEGGEEQYVAALFRGQIHFFIHSFKNLLVPTMSGTLSPKAEGERPILS